MTIRSIAAALVLVACTSHGERAQNTPVPAGAAPAPETPGLVSHVPTVATADVIGTPDGAPPLLVLLDASGKISIGAGPSSWSALGAFDPTGKMKPFELHDVSPFVREAQGMGWTPQQAMDHKDKRIDLSDLADEPAAPSNPDDPPPPPAEAAVERPRTPEQLARDARIDVSGGIGWHLPRLPARPGEQVVYPERFADIVGEVVDSNRLAPHQFALVVAHPRAKAAALIGVIAMTQGLIAVAQGGKLVPLNLQFLAAPSNGNIFAPWTEIRVGPSSFEVEAVPDQPVTVNFATGALDPTVVANAVATATVHHHRDRLAPIDVLVAPEIDAQRLIYVLVALDRAGFRAIGLGSRPPAGDPQLAVRGHRIPKFQMSRMTLKGAMTKRSVGNVLDQSAALAACYVSSLAKNPELAGTLHVAFTVGETGSVVVSTSEGVDADVATCVAATLAKILFPAGRASVEAWFSLAPDAR